MAEIKAEARVWRVIESFFEVKDENYSDIGYRLAERIRLELSEVPDDNQIIAIEFDYPEDKDLIRHLRQAAQKGKEAFTSIVHAASQLPFEILVEKVFKASEP